MVGPAAEVYPRSVPSVAGSRGTDARIRKPDRLVAPMDPFVSGSRTLTSYFLMFEQISRTKISWKPGPQLLDAYAADGMRPQVAL